MPVLTDNTRGSLLMMASMASFTLNDTFMKALAGEVPLFQAIFLRGVATTLMMVGLALWTGALRPRLAPSDRWRVGLRTLCDIGATYFFLTALFNMPIANATAILQALPLTVTLAGALFMGEAVGWRRLSAILVGLFGVLLIVRPGLAGFNVFSVYVLIAVAFVTGRDLVTRGLSAHVPSLAVALAGSIGVTAFAAVAALGEDWVPVAPVATARLAGAAVLIIGGYLFSVMAMRVGEVAVVTPFRYTGLLWALVAGLVAFGDWPDPLTLVGSAIVVATGLYTFYRERQLAARLRARPG